MKKQQIKRVFEKIKELAKLDFADTTPMGDCQTCTWADIELEFGKESKGIWLKHWTFGMNKTKWDENETYYIAHDLTSRQKEIVYNELSKHFAVDWDKSDNKAIGINNKGEE